MSFVIGFLLGITVLAAVEVAVVYTWTQWKKVESEAIHDLYHYDLRHERVAKGPLST